MEGLDDVDCRHSVWLGRETVKFDDECRCDFSRTTSLLALNTSRHPADTLDVSLSHGSPRNTNIDKVWVVVEWTKRATERIWRWTRR